MSQPSQSATHPQYIWFNGKLVPWQDAQVHVMSHALHYGSSVFEGYAPTIPPKAPAFSVCRSTPAACSIPPRSTGWTSPTASPK